MVLITCSLEVAKIHFWIMGIRGDWKALKQLLNFERRMNVNQEGVPRYYCFERFATAQSTPEL